MHLFAHFTHRDLILLAIGIIIAVGIFAKAIKNLPDANRVPVAATSLALVIAIVLVTALLPACHPLDAARWYRVRPIFVSMPHHPPVYYGLIVATIVVGIAVLALLQLIPTRYRKATIAIGTFLGGLYYATEFFLPTAPGTAENQLSPYQTDVANVANVIGSFSVGLGLVSLIGMHLKTISRRREGWGFSFALISSFVFMAIFHLLVTYDPTFVFLKPHGIILAPVTTADVYNFLFKGGLNSLDAAMFALIGFFIISASYRAFRVRSFEASLLMFSALIVMLGQVTLGTWITGHLPTTGTLSAFRFENMAQYILVNINTPAQRAVAFGIGLGVLATSLRLWLSLERGVFFDTPEEG